MKKYLIILIVLMPLASCNSYNKDLGVNVDVMYAEALGKFNAGDMEKAKIIFQKISDEYPFREEAVEAQVFLIWIYYIQDDFISADIAIDSFLRYYISNEYTPWVNYMNALINYEQMGDTQKDQRFTNTALIEFTNVIKKYPNTKYTKDAIFRIQAIKHNLAKRNMQIASYYIKNKNYIAAIGRYQEITTHYQDTIFVQEAMYRLVYLWLVLGIDEEAFRVNSVLGYNYSYSIWYAQSLKLIKKYTSYSDEQVVVSTR